MKLEVTRWDMKPPKYEDHRFTFYAELTDAEFKGLSRDGVPLEKRLVKLAKEYIGKTAGKTSKANDHSAVDLQGGTKPCKVPSLELVELIDRYKTLKLAFEKAGYEKVGEIDGWIPVFRMPDGQGDDYIRTTNSIIGSGMSKFVRDIMKEMATGVRADPFPRDGNPDPNGASEKGEKEHGT